ncbi:hypothetical protein [Halobellus salinisoli]|uniref:hypothetical protein n=1 Tax=Halobellus salinisoli TaxID=3108500 RepID=UPI00300B6854
MSRASAAVSVVLGAGFSTLAAVITDLTVYDGSGTLIVSVPLALGMIYAVDELVRHRDGDELPDGLTDQEIRDLGGDPDA